MLLNYYPKDVDIKNILKLKFIKWLTIIFSIYIINKILRYSPKVDIVYYLFFLDNISWYFIMYLYHSMNEYNIEK